MLTIKANICKLLLSLKIIHVIYWIISLVCKPSVIIMFLKLGNRSIYMKDQLQFVNNKA
jgi:hypothetical protein